MICSRCNSHNDGNICVHCAADQTISARHMFSNYSLYQFYWDKYSYPAPGSDKWIDFVNDVRLNVTHLPLIVRPAR